MITDEGVRVAILFKNELHPAHAGFADAIGADRVQLPTLKHDLLSGSLLEDVVSVLKRLRSLPTDYDVYLSEDIAGLYASCYLTSRMGGTNVHLAAHHRIFGLDGYDIRLRGPRNMAKWADRAADITIIHLLLRKRVDGVIAVSELVARDVSTVAPDLPVRVANSYIESDLFERLDAVEPALDDNHAVFVGKNRTHKGVDMLCRAWPQVRTRYPNATLELVGRDHTERNVAGVTVTGYVEDITDAYWHASLYVQPARFDAFAVSVLEAMRAGVPAIGTTNCGVTRYLSAIDPTLDCEPTPADIANAVASHFDRSREQRRAISTAVRDVASAFDPMRGKRVFAEQFQRLLADIGVVRDARYDATPSER